MRGEGPAARHPLQWRCKAIADRVLSAAALLVLSPVLLLVAAVVLVSSPGPVLYRRRVVGRDGAEFDALKFRTMVADADERLRHDPELRRRYRAHAKPRDDPRVTRAGRVLRPSSVDELPQLWNVLRGEMSLVGPRMMTREELPENAEVARKRLSVKPGMTGLWQVAGRQELGYDERVRLDLAYVDDWSLWLDVRILLRTIPAILSMRGAY